MRALKAQNGRIPRGYPDHRRLEGRQYTAYCRAVLARFGPLPDVALPTLREAGRLVVELDAIGRELALARTRRRRRDAALAAATDDPDAHAAPQARRAARTPCARVVATI